MIKEKLLSGFGRGIYVFSLLNKEIMGMEYQQLGSANAFTPGLTILLK